MRAGAGRKRCRRALTDEELKALVGATRASEQLFRGLSGTDRAMLYLVASNTGLRAGELASLTPALFDLASDPPTVRVLRGYTKNGEEAELPLRADLVAMLCPLIANRRADEPLWPGTEASPDALGTPSAPR